MNYYAGPWDKEARPLTKITFFAAFHTYNEFSSMIFLRRRHRVFNLSDSDIVVSALI